MATFAWNEQQEALFAFITGSTRNVTVGAVAGSGKTTSIEEMIRRIVADDFGADVLYTVFNKHNREGAEKKFGHMATVKTIHQLGYKMIQTHTGIRRLDMNDYKYNNIIGELLEKRGIMDAQLRRTLGDEYKNLLNMMRVTLTDPHDKHALFELCDKYGIEFEDWMFDELPMVVELGVEMMTKTGKIDFTDMIFMPVHLGMKCETFGWVMVDEAQDLSNCQRVLVLMHLAEGGRFGAVGDEFQSIYGFAGANPASYRMIREATDSVEMPLSVCYRCPQSHIKLAQQLVPGIQWAPGAKEGIVSHNAEDQLHRDVKAGDLILCRNTAPLVTNCIRLIKEGIRSNVRGRNIGAGLNSVIKKIDEKKHYTAHSFAIEFKRDLEAYSEKEMAKLVARNASEGVIDSFLDKIMCIEIIYDEFDAVNPKELMDRINYVFSDTPASIVFSSIHRAKGLENSVVRILRGDRMSLRWKNQTDEERQQEDNAKYVGLTRAKDEMHFYYEDAGIAEDMADLAA